MAICLFFHHNSFAKETYINLFTSHEVYLQNDHNKNSRYRTFARPIRPLMLPDGLLRLPQEGETCGFTYPFKGPAALRFYKTSRFFDCRKRAKKWVSSCNGGPSTLQRRARWIATAAPLQSNKGPVATPRGRYCNLAEALSENRETASVLKRLNIKTLRKL